MKNPVYYRLVKDENFVGIKRVVTEFLPAGYATWQLDPIECDEAETKKLGSPPMGVAVLKRERISS